MPYVGTGCRSLIDHVEAERQVALDVHAELGQFVSERVRRDREESPPHDPASAHPPWVESPTHREQRVMATTVPRETAALPQAPTASASIVTAGRDPLVVSLFAAGLLIRLLLVSSKGTTDMDSYIAWGRDVVDHDLAFAYHGIYFPLQYEIFAYVVRLSALLDLSEITTVKAVNLACDTGAFLVLTILLTRFRLPSRYACSSTGSRRTSWPSTGWATSMRRSGSSCC